MAYLPEDVSNQALDQAGVEYTIGSLTEGTRPAQVLLRAYSQCLQQLLRAAPWAFARREAPLTLLADVTGQTPNVGTQVPSGFIYEYAYPIDCARIRYIPWFPFQNPGAPTNNIQPANPSSPVVTNLGQPPFAGVRPRPARYLITNDPNYPPQAGQINWEVQGVSPQGRTVILTNVQNALCVYTVTVLYPSVWDHLFRAAMVAYLASEIAVPLAKDKKFGLTMRAQNISIAKVKIGEARAMDGNEMWASSDFSTDWMRFRNAGHGMGNDGYGSGGFGGYGTWGGGWGGSIELGGSAY